MDLETVSHFGIQNQEKQQKGAKVGPRRLPEWTLKSVEMDNWTSRCLLGVPVAPWTTKMVTQDTRTEHQGHQHNSFGYKKRPISGVIQSSVACWSKGGRRQGRSLKINLCIYKCEPEHIHARSEGSRAKWIRVKWRQASLLEWFLWAWNAHHRPQ